MTPTYRYAYTYTYEYMHINISQLIQQFQSMCFYWSINVFVCVSVRVCWAAFVVVVHAPSFSAFIPSLDCNQLRFNCNCAPIQSQLRR